METTKTVGILSTLEALYKNMTHDQLVGELMSLWQSNFEETKNRNKAGALGKAKVNYPKKVAAAEEYLRLITSGKEVSAQRLHDSLKAHYPNETWNYNTIRDWHKLIKAAVTEIPKEN